MKFILAITFLIAGISASVLPESEITVSGKSSERIVTNQIESAIYEASQAIKDAGLDPFVIERESKAFALPVPRIFSAEASIEDILSIGLSDIRINSLVFNVLTSRLFFDLELPYIQLSAGNVFGRATVFGETLEAEASGSVEVRNVRVNGVVVVRVGIISGISLRRVTVNFNLGRIDSNLQVGIAGYNISDKVNNFLGQTIPDTLTAFKNDINTLLEIYLYDIISANL